MTFAHPVWFWAFALVPLLLAVFARNEVQRSVFVRKLVAARLEGQLAGSASPGKRRMRFFVLLLGLAAIIVSLTQPRWGYTYEQEKRHGRDVLIAIDVSRSMLANDLSPSRLARAKLAAEDLISQLAGDRIGLIAFAGNAFLQAPLTFDHGAVLSALRELDTTIIPRGGTDIAEAIRESVDAFGKGESDNRALVLFTDGEELEESGLDTAKELNGAVRIFTVGLGSPEGTIIALPGKKGQTEYVKDDSGQIVKSKLDESRLREIAESTKGFYVHLTSGPAEMEQIVRDGLKPMTEQDIDAQSVRHPIERYQWPLGAGIVLLAASLLIGERKRSVRRRSLAVAVIVLSAFLALPAQAKNTGVKAYEEEDYKGALDSFEKQLEKKPDSDALHFDVGSAAYKTGDYDRAMEGFSAAVTSSDPLLRQKAEYNLGNTLFQRGVNKKETPAKIQELKNAIEHYESAIKAEPKDNDAQFNRDLAKKLIAQLEQQQQQQQQQNQDKKQDQKDQKDQNQQQQKNQQSQSQDQKDQKDQQQQQQSQNQQNQQNQSQQQQNSDQQQQQGQKDQQQNGEQKDQNQQQASSKDQQMQDQSGKDQKDSEKKDQGDQQKQQEQQQQKSEKDQGNKNDKDQSPDQQQADRKLSGEIKDANQQQQKQQQQPPQPQPQDAGKETPEQRAAEEAQAAAENRMTKGQARSLLDSLKDDDRRVRLLTPTDKKPSSAGKYRDW